MSEPAILMHQLILYKPFSKFLNMSNWDCDTSFSSGQSGETSEHIFFLPKNQNSLKSIFIYKNSLFFSRAKRHLDQNEPKLLKMNSLHQFEHIMTHSHSFDHLFGESTNIETNFRIIHCSESSNERLRHSWRRTKSKFFSNYFLEKLRDSGHIDVGDKFITSVTEFMHAGDIIGILKQNACLKNGDKTVKMLQRSNGNTDISQFVGFWAVGVRIDFL